MLAQQHARRAVAPLKRLVRRTRGLRIIPPGDSITATGSVYSGGAWQFAGGVQELAIRMAGPRFQQIRNAGVAGNTATQLLARFQTDVLDYEPDVVPIMIGTNHFISGMATSAYASLFNPLETMVRMTLSANAVPVIVVPPVKNSAAAESRRAVPFYYRIAQYYDVPLVDLFKVSVDPATGNWLAGYATDGTHPDDAGIVALAPSLATVLQNIESSYCPPYLAAYSQTATGDLANLIRNGSFAQQAVAGIPDGWSISVASGGSYTANTAPAAPYTGKEFIYTKTADGAAYALSGAAAAVAPGDEIVFSGSIEVSGLTGTTSGFHLALELGGGVNLRPFLSWKHNGAFPFSVPLTVPAGKATITPTFYVQDGDEETEAVYKVRNLTAINLTTMDAIWAPGVN
jgi:lysophospholipase L1-like esterase